MGIGKRCGGSHISSSYVCRIEQGYPHLEKIKGAAGYEKIEKALQNFESSLESVHPESQQVWRDAFNDWMTKTDGNGPVFPYDELDKGKPGKTGADKVVAGVTKMQDLLDNYPETIKMDNFEIPAPVDLIPKYSSGGEAYLCDPIFGERMFRDKKNFDPKSIKLEGKGGSFDLPYLTGEAQAAIAFREERRAAGLPWPMQPKPVDKAQVEMEFSKLDKKILSNIANKSQLGDYYKEGNNRDDRGRNIVEGWLKFDKLSPVTGRPVPIPEVMEKVGGTRTTVDHAQAFSDFVKRGLKGEALAKAAENPGNLDIVEHNLNIAKKAKPWDRTVDDLVSHQPKLMKSISDYEARENFPTAPKSKYSQITGDKNPSWEDLNAMSAAQWKHRQALAQSYRDRISNPPGAPKVDLESMMRPVESKTSGSRRSGSGRSSEGKRANVTEGILRMSDEQIREWAKGKNIGTLGEAKLRERGISI